jgi:hypothetical protein
MRAARHADGQVLLVVAGAAAVRTSSGRGGRCRYRVVRVMPVLVTISVIVAPVSRRWVA